MTPLEIAAALALVFALGVGCGYRWGRTGAKSLLPFLTVAVIAGPALASPPEAVAAAVAYVRDMPADAAVYARFLDLSHLSIKDARSTALNVLSFHINSLSRNPDVIVPKAVAGGGLLVIDLRDYEIDKATWEKLGTPEAREPYFHVILEKTYTYPAQAQPTYSPGYQQAYPQPAAPTKKTVRESAAAPWLPTKEISELVNRTQSSVPIVRGDWFFVATAIQKGRAVGYYDFLGLGKKEADFQKLIGANAAEAKRLKLEMAASVALSGVAINNRGITRLQSLTGGYWFTADYKTSVDRQNVARLLAGDTEPPQGDASEQFGVLSNGLFAYWLQDANGNRQDVVPQEFALDHKATSNDRNIYAGTLSCVRCHVEGLRPIDDFARKLYRGPIQLTSPNYERFKRLRQLYLTDLPAKQLEDNSRFGAAVKQCNGLTVVDNARAVGQFWASYLDEPVTPAVLATELGCSEERLVAAVKAHVAKGPIVDPVLAAFAQVPPVPLRREHIEEAYPFFVDLMKGTLP